VDKRCLPPEERNGGHGRGNSSTLFPSQTPFATTKITTKRPLPALAFGLVRLAVTQAARVDIRDGEKVTTFSQVAIQGTQLPDTREVAVIARGGERLTAAGHIEQTQETTALERMYEPLRRP
jgi:hypothetical protein